MLSWFYLFVHYTKVDSVNEKLRAHFNTFIHRTTKYTRKKNHIQKIDAPTISGLIFVQGDSADIQKILQEIYPGLHLVNDCTTRKTAVISNEVMQTFIQFSQLNPNRIRFMPHPLSYYAFGHSLVKITSGILAGIEGYKIRISRDQCLITSIGNMTIAIKGICKESFENVDEYILQRKKELSTSKDSADIVFTPIQADIDKCFFSPQNRLDVLTIAQHLEKWQKKAISLMHRNCFEKAAEIALFVLEEIGSRFYIVFNKENSKDITMLCSKFDEILFSISNLSTIPANLKLHIASERQSLIIRYPFLPISNN